MHISEEEEFKKEFQLERVILFTDAVFAIILTIMVLDIKLPEDIKLADSATIQHAFKELVFKFLTYLLSFGLVGKFWVSHLRLFKYLKDYDTRLLVLNLIFLFMVSLFPLAVSMLIGKIRPSAPEFTWVWTIYVLVIYLTVLAQSFITAYLLRHRERLCIAAANLEDHFKWKVQRINFVAIPILAAGIIYFNIMGLNYVYAMYTVALYGIIMGRLSKRFYPKPEPVAALATLFRRRVTSKKADKIEG